MPRRRTGKWPSWGTFSGQIFQDKRYNFPHCEIWQFAGHFMCAICDRRSDSRQNSTKIFPAIFRTLERKKAASAESWPYLLFFRINVHMYVDTYTWYLPACMYVSVFDFDTQKNIGTVVKNALKKFSRNAITVPWKFIKGKRKENESVYMERWACAIYTVLKIYTKLIIRFLFNHYVIIPIYIYEYIYISRL